MLAMQSLGGAVCEISTIVIHYIHIWRTQQYQQYINQWKHAHILTYYDTRNIDVTKKTWIHMVENPRPCHLNIHINTFNTLLYARYAISWWRRLRNIDHCHTLYTYMTNTTISTIYKSMKTCTYPYILWYQKYWRY